MDYYESYLQQLQQTINVLGSSWPGYGAINDAVQATRQQLQTVKSGRHIERPVIGVAGLKNAGKTTLLSWLLNTQQMFSELKQGVTHDAGTQHITWISEQRPSGLDAEDIFIEVESDTLFDLGSAYCLLDIPGSNESHQTLGDRAIKGLNNSLVVLLVVTENQLEDERALEQYLHHSHNSIIVPIINIVSGQASSQQQLAAASPLAPDHALFQARLRQKMPPDTTILTPIVVPDFDSVRIEDPQRFKAACKAYFRSALKSGLQPYLGSRELNTLRSKQAQNIFTDFQQQVQQVSVRHLQRFSQINEELQRIEDDLPKMALLSLIEPEAVLNNALKQGSSGQLLQRTPFWSFPWRPVLSLMALLRGALDKVPLLLGGSISAVVQSGIAAAGNIKSGQHLKALIDNRLQTQLDQRIRKDAEPWLLNSQSALETDLKRSVNIAEPELIVNGLESLQLEFGKLIEDIIGQYTLRPASVFGLSLVALFIFWGLFSWPVIDVYSQFFGGITQTLHSSVSSSVDEVKVVAQPAFGHLISASGAIFNSFILSILPVMVLAGCVVAFNCRQSKIKKMQKKIIARQQLLVRQQHERGLLTIQVDLPEIAACRFLLEEVE